MVKKQLFTQSDKSRISTIRIIYIVKRLKMRRTEAYAGRILYAAWVYMGGSYHSNEGTELPVPQLGRRDFTDIIRHSTIVL